MDELDKFLGVDIQGSYRDKMKTIHNVFHSTEEEGYRY